MGYTILLQWTWQPPQGQKVNLSDVILQRVLEHYGLTHPIRSTVQFRTFRSSFPSPPSPTVTKSLTTIAYSQPFPPGSSTAASKTPKDDVMYLFLEDRGTSSTQPTVPTTVTSGETPDPAIEVDGFEIVNAPSSTPKLEGDVKEEAEKVSAVSNKDRRYQTLAVRPAVAVVPLLQTLLSGFVLGMTKSARAAASTTSQALTPTPIPGVPLLLTSLRFPPLTSPSPGITLTMHNFPNQSATSIFLEAEWTDSSVSRGTGEDGDVVDILKEFLEGCLPDGIGGNKRWGIWEDAGVDEEEDEEGEDGDGWEGVERGKRVSEVLAKCLKEGGYI